MFSTTRCPGCDAIGPVPCAACVAAMAPAWALAVPPSLDSCRALLTYAGPARELVAQLKYRNARASARWLADGLAALVVPGSVDVVTWAPTTAQRRRARGFDHAELLARRTAASCGVPCRPLLRRSPGPPQTGRSALERRRGPVFEPRGRSAGRRVLVVDDVVTTGATFEAAGRALRAGGAGWVGGLAVAHPL